MRGSWARPFRFLSALSPRCHLFGTIPLRHLRWALRCRSKRQARRESSVACSEWPVCAIAGNAIPLRVNASQRREIQPEFVVRAIYLKSRASLSQAGVQCFVRSVLFAQHTALLKLASGLLVWPGRCAIGTVRRKQLQQQNLAAQTEFREGIGKSPSWRGHTRLGVCVEKAEKARKRSLRCLQEATRQKGRVVVVSARRLCSVCLEVGRERLRSKSRGSQRKVGIKEAR